MSFIDERETYMALALAEAEKAAAEGETPVGAVLVKRGRVLAAAHNRCVAEKDPTAHAELLVLRAAAPLLSGRFTDCTLYVTLEPCAMCAGAMVNAKLPRLVFGAFDARAGCCSSVFDLTNHCFYHTVETWGGILEEPCASILTAFFEARREHDQ